MVRNVERFGADLVFFSADEKIVLLGFLADGGDQAFVERLAQARRRTAQRQESDAETDKGRRLLVGARLPRPLAEKYRACAKARGISLYRFVCLALEREYSNGCSRQPVVDRISRTNVRLPGAN